MTDPRIHERRVAVARQHGRRRRNRILAVLVVFCLAAAGFALAHSSLLGARHVRVSGAPNIPASTIVKVAGLSGEPPLLDLNPGAITSRIERLPWVLSAKVHIAWPTTVSIELTERIAVAALAMPGTEGWAVCDVTGRVLEIVASRPLSLPEVVLGPADGVPGHPGSSLPARDVPALQVAASLPESMVPQTTDVTTGSLGAEVALSDGITALLGSSDSLAEKFVALATVIAKGNLSGIATVDLRVPTAPVLLPKGTSPILPGNVAG